MVTVPLNIFPRLPVHDAVDLRLADPVMAGKGGLRHPFIGSPSYLPDNFARQFPHRMALTRIVGAVNNAIKAVLLRSRPPQMARIDAAKVCFPATVGCKMPVSWRGAMQSLTIYPSDGKMGTHRADPYPPISVDFLVRPNQAGFTAFWENYFLKKSLRLAVIRSKLNWVRSTNITVNAQSLIVSVAEALCFVRLAASFNAAYAGISHISNLPCSVVVRARRALARFGGFARSTLINGGIQ